MLEVAQDREPVPVLVEVPEVRRGEAVVQLVPVPEVQRVHVARDAGGQEPKKDVCDGLGVERLLEAHRGRGGAAVIEVSQWPKAKSVRCWKPRFLKDARWLTEYPE